VFAGAGPGTAGIAAVAEAARTAPALTAPRSVDLLLDGLAAQLTEGHATGTPILRRALADFRADDIRWYLLAVHVADDLWDDQTAHALSLQMVRLARRSGRLAWQPQIVSCLAYRSLCEGDVEAAARLLEEAQSVGGAAGVETPDWARALLAAWRGHEDDEGAAPRGEGVFHRVATEYACAVLHNGLGQYDTALGAAQRALVGGDLFLPWLLSELVEAAVRCDDLDLAGAAVVRVCDRARASGTVLALGAQSVACALVSRGDAADRLYRDGIEQLGRTRIVAYRARAQLLYGEWLRREGRRLESRAQLQTANEVFAAMGADAFAERAARELLATGQRARSRTAQSLGQLTLREAQVAQLAREGHTNKAIGSRLFISDRTVEYHLHKVYTKLGIASRNQLHQALGGAQPSRPLTPVPAPAPSFALPRR
jgi:ATP/maltotriose-dependent transcriptional regulator MalT